MASKDWGNEIEVYLDERDLAQQVGTSLSLAKQLGSSPDQESELQQVSKRLGIPLDTARNMPNETRQAAEDADFDPFDFSQKSPATARYLSNPDNAAISNDEIPVLGQVEQNLRGFGGSAFEQAKEAGARIDATNPQALRQEALQKFGFANASVLSREIDKQQVLSGLPQMQAGNGKVGEFTYGDATRKAVGSVKLTWDFLADRLAGALGMDQTETRRIMGETSAYINELGKDFETELAFDRARTNGNGTVLGTMSALGSAMSQADDPSAVVGKFFTEQLVASVPGAVLGGAFAAPLRASAQTFIRNELVAKGVSAGLAGASASATAVVVQSLGSNYKEGIEQGLGTTEAASRAWTKTLAEVPANAIAGAAVGLRIGPNALSNVFAQTAIQGVGGGVGAASASLSVGEVVDPLEVALEILGEGIGAGPDILIAGATLPQEIEARARAEERQQRRQQAADTATAHAQSLDELMTTAAASMTRQRSPEGFAQLVQEAAERSGTAPTELFIDAQPLLQIIQNAGMTQEQLTQVLPSVAEQLDEAVATDGTLTIPIGEATAAFAGTGFEQELVRHSRTDANALSLADAEEAGATVDALGAEAEQIIAEQQDKDAWDASSRVVFDQVYTDLNTGGRFTPEVNKAYATVVRDYYTVQASKLSITPDQLYTQFPLTSRAARIGVRPVLDQGGEGAFGPILTEFKGDAQGAIAKLMEMKNGEAIGALSHPDIGDIDLVWGIEGTGASDGYGLAKLLKYHPEVVPELQNIINKMKVTTRSKNRINLESVDHRAGVRLTWDGKAKTWLLTAFEKKNEGALDTRTDTAEFSDGGDTARPNDALDQILEQKLNEFYNGQQGAARAMFDPATLNIALLEKANLSSFLHELGHAFFEISAHLASQPNAPQSIKDDIQTLFTATGYTDTAQEWLALPVNERRIAHETIAESFEQYLLDGKAPTLEQQMLFSKMRSWMISVYNNLAEFLGKNTNAMLTPEVRAVFDRMLANDDTIAEAKLARAGAPLFTSAEQAGMTPEQFADYQRAVGDIDEEAVRELDSRSLRDLKWLRTARSRKLKALQADATIKRRNARIEARRQLMNQPVYRALNFLRGKVAAVPIERRSSKGIDTRRDDLATAIAKLGGLNKEAAIAEFGLDPKSLLTQLVGQPILRAGKAGKTPDAMAEALAELGYLQADGNEKHDLNELSDKLHDQDRGISHYSLEVDWDLIHGYKTVPAPADAEEATFSAGRLSLPEMESRFANRPDVDWAKLGVGRRGMINKSGMAMDLVAEVTGFATGEEMVLALIEAEPLNAATEALTDRIMLERYGDISSPEALEQAADEALAGEARSRMVAAELARLNTAVGSARIVQAVARETAQKVVARQIIRHVRPDKSAGAVARAGKGAEAAFRKGDVDTAAGFKRSQVLNLAIEREQRKTRTEIEKARDNFAAMFGNDKRAAKTRDMNLVNAARAMVAQYGLSPEVAGQRATDYLKVLRKYNPAMADNIESLFESLPEPKDYRELTVEEFRGMRDAVLGIYQMSRRVMQTRIDGKLVEQDEVATVLVEAVLDRNGGELPASFGAGGTPTYKQKLKLGLLGLKAAGTRVEQWADAMGGDVKRILYQQVSDGAVKARSKRNELISQYKLLLEKVAPGMTYTPIVATEFDGYKFNAGKSELLHAILHSGNPSNFRKLLLGNTREGFVWGGLNPDGTLDTSRWDAFIQHMVDERVLTKADFDFAQGVWDLLETVKQDAQRAHFDIYGYYFNEITAAPIQTPFGEYRGGYVPALVDPLQAPEQQQKQDAEAAQSGGTMFPTTGKGFTKARVEYNRPLELDLRTIGSHLDKVARFAYLEPAIHDAARLLQNKRVASALNRLDPNIISKLLMPWLDRTAKQTTSIPTRFPLADKLFRIVRSRSGMYLMFASVINAAQQITSLSVAAVKVPAPKLMRALKAYTANPGEMSRIAAELSPFLRDRLDNQGFEMTQQIEAILTNPNVLDKSSDFMKRNAYFLQTGVQNVLDVVIWSGAYDHAMSKPAATELEAIRYADEVVRTTQGSFLPEDVSAMEVQPAFIQLFTQFWGYFNMLANTLGAEAGKSVREMGYMAATPRLMFIWFAGMTIPAVVGQMIAQGLPDDEDDEDGDGLLDEWLAMFFGSQAKTLAAMAPGIGQLSMLAANQFDGKVYNDRLNLSPGLSLIESAAGGSKALLQGDAFDGRLTKKEVRDVATLVALATGAPTNVIAKPVGYLLDVEEGRKNPENIADYAVGLTTGH